MKFGLHRQWNILAHATAQMKFGNMMSDQRCKPGREEHCMMLFVRGAQNWLIHITRGSRDFQGLEVGRRRTMSKDHRISVQEDELYLETLTKHYSSFMFLIYLIQSLYTFLWVHTCKCASVYTQVKAQSQPWCSFLRSNPAFFWRQMSLNDQEINKQDSGQSASRSNTFLVGLTSTILISLLSHGLWGFCSNAQVCRVRNLLTVLWPQP